MMRLTGSRPQWRSGQSRHDMGAHAAAGSSDTATGPSTGKKMVNCVPLPGSLATSIDPPWLVTMPWTTESPSPVPSPTAFVVKKGSKIRFFVSASMPQPVSTIRRRVKLPVEDRDRVVVERPTVIVPIRPPMACTALVTKFTTTCWIWLGSARISNIFDLFNDEYRRRDRRAQHLESLTDDRREVDPCLRRLLIPAKSEDAPYEVASVVGRLHNGFQILALSASFRGFPQQQLRQHEDRHQGIIEVVRDAAGEGAERFELLGMEQLALEFGFPLLGRPLFG